MEKEKKKHSFIGKASLTLVIILIIMFIINLFSIISSGFGNFIFWGFTDILNFIVFSFLIGVIIWGVIAYFGKGKDIYGLIGTVLAICLLVSAPFLITAAHDIWLENNEPIVDGSPIQFQKNETARTLVLVNVGVDHGYEWEDFEITGNATAPIGPIKVGDVITNCTGIIIIRYTATKPERLIGTWTFD